VGHPPDPEADSLVRVVPGAGEILRLAGGKLLLQSGVRPVQERQRLFVGELLRRPGLGLGALTHGERLMQVDLTNVVGQVGDCPAGTGRYGRAKVYRHDGPEAGEVGREAVEKFGIIHAQQFNTRQPSLGEYLDVPGAEFQIARLGVILGEDVGHIVRQSELDGSPAPIVDDMDPLASRIGRRVDGH
jgi:hypothetical protein